ncbi:amino acid ABC transporter permease [Bosea sp. (in: a-proteobacteria)]|uniref:amino acid ABC transporter permease n=1 Tax=Bosea sp. (in: a-proteobacteria) TaxID=1871050 RepID=UPI00260238D1|nr:amino acid ABC transporter permease [Bosea sp. (in: a-proteobacteria)]MCO5091238.1 amino acid ABC transporter permease [Bosea sp. (in: a-proteobacteria)]
MISLWLTIYPQLLSAAWATVQLAALSLVLGLSWGLVVALARRSRSPALQRAAGFYVQVFRGTPALIQLFLIYFGLAEFGVKLSSFQAAVLGLGLNTAAYMAEIYRAGIEAISRGQTEAAMAIGMRPLQAMRWIVLPQAIRVVLPPIGNVMINLLKDTSVASLIAAPDLMLRAQDLSAEYFRPLEIYIMVGVVYFLMCFPLSLLLRRFERRGARAG